MRRAPKDGWRFSSLIQHDLHLHIWFEETRKSMIEDICNVDLNLYSTDISFEGMQKLVGIN